MGGGEGNSQRANERDSIPVSRSGAATRRFKSVFISVHPRLKLFSNAFNLRQLAKISGSKFCELPCVPWLKMGLKPLSLTWRLTPLLRRVAAPLRETLPCISNDFKLSSYAFQLCVFVTWCETPYRSSTSPSSVPILNRNKNRPNFSLFKPRKSR